MTDTVPLVVKWNKDTLKVDFVVAGGAKGLKTELEEKTGVPADRMKLMAKSKGNSHNSHALHLLNVISSVASYDFLSCSVLIFFRPLEGCA